MPRGKPKFAPGDEVRVRQGVTDPDFPDIPIGGWAGAVTEIQRGPTLYLIRWNRRTLENMHPVYRKRCERDGLDGEEMWLGEDALEPDTGEPAEIEQPRHIETKPLDLSDQDDRIRAALGLTSDDPLAEGDFDTLRIYRDYLAENLTFPFEVEWDSEFGRFSSRSQTVMVTGLGEPDEDFRLDDMYGLICEVRFDGHPGDAPLAEMEVKQKGENRQLVEDYCFWFWNCR